MQERELRRRHSRPANGEECDIAGDTQACNPFTSYGRGLATTHHGSGLARSADAAGFGPSWSCMAAARAGHGAADVVPRHWITGDDREHRSLL